MQLPPIREKVSGLSRLLKVIYLFLFVVILILITEGFYYFWLSEKKTGESKYINTEVVYQKGVLLYSKTSNEPIAARGWVRKIDNGILTLENQGEEILVETESEFRYSVIQEIGENTEKFELIAGPKTLKITDLANNVKTGDFVVVTRLTNSNLGVIKGGMLSVLNFF